MNDVATLELPRASTGVAYLRRGAGPPLVLCHGGAGSWTHWTRNIDALARHFAVLALDSPGYGASFAPPRDIPPDDYIAIVRATVEEICGTAPRVAVSGFSFGGFMATTIAAGLGARAASLSLIGCSGFEPPTGRELNLMSLRRLRERLGREPRADEIEDMHRTNLGELMIWDRALIDRQAVRLQMQNVAHMRFDSRRLSWSGRLPEFLAPVTCPVKMIYGAQDRSAYPSVEARLAQCRAIKPELEAEILEDCGHWAMYEAPERVNALLLAFHTRA